MKRFLFSLLATVASSMHAADSAAIIDGPNYAFTIAAPKGWKLTSTNELQAAFHPDGTTFDKSSVVMYTRPTDKRQLHVSSITELNHLDLKGIQQQHPNAKSQPVGTVKTSSGAEIPLFAFTGGGYDELVAYAEQPKTITVFVLSAQTEAQLKRGRAAFEELLSSYVALDPTTKSKDGKPTQK